MSYRQWTKWFFVTIAVVVALFAGFNYTIDPLWTFCHSNRYNNAQPGFNERQLKTNRAYFCGLESYDALLLGSSRTTYINQHDFEGMRLFNYAGVSMYPHEYKGWIDQAKRIKGGVFDTILLGVDFFGSNDGVFGRQQMRETPKASTYLETSMGLMYRYTMLFGQETLHKSIESIEHSRHLGTTDYTRDNIKQTIHISKERKAQAVAQQRGLYGQSVYGKAYHYNTQVKGQLEKIRDENPRSRFVIFTTPISQELFTLMVKKGNLEAYKRWLGMLVDVFGEVYQFMGINSITSNPSNYADLHHFYPDIGKLMADRMTQRPNPSLPSDFGLLLNRENLKAYLEHVDQEAKALYL